MSIITKD